MTTEQTDDFFRASSQTGELLRGMRRKKEGKKVKSWTIGYGQPVPPKEVSNKLESNRRETVKITSPLMREYVRNLFACISNQLWFTPLNLTNFWRCIGMQCRSVRFKRLFLPHRRIYFTSNTILKLLYLIRSNFNTNVGKQLRFSSIFIKLTVYPRQIIAFSQATAKRKSTLKTL